MHAPVHFLTPEGRRRLEKELEFLRTVRRREVAANLRSTLEEGDLTENAGYDEWKRAQAFVEGRIREVEAILANPRLLKVSDDHDVVCLGARVTVAEEGREPETYQIVGRAEADPLAGRISNESPLGAALLGHRIGGKVQVKAPSGLINFEILGIQ